jgi:hypothetical protein
MSGSGAAMLLAKMLRRKHGCAESRHCAMNARGPHDSR